MSSIVNRSMDFARKFLFFLCLATGAFCLPARIHVFGDSNVFYSFSNDPVFPDIQGKLYTINQLHHYGDLQVQFVLHGLISKTMHGVVKRGVIDFRAEGVQENDTVVFHFGCVDIFSDHIQRQTKHRQFDEIVDTLVGNYVRWISRNRMTYRNLRCVVMCVLPPFHHEKATLTQIVNGKLQEYCAAYRIDFLDAYEFYATSTGGLDFSKSNHGDHHVGTEYNYLIREKLLKLLNLS